MKATLNALSKHLGSRRALALRQLELPYPFRPDRLVSPPYHGQEANMHRFNTPRTRPLLICLLVIFEALQINPFTGTAHPKTSGSLPWKQLLIRSPLLPLDTPGDRWEPRRVIQLAHPLLQLPGNSIPPTCKDLKHLPPITGRVILSTRRPHRRWEQHVITLT